MRSVLLLVAAVVLMLVSSATSYGQCAGGQCASCGGSQCDVVVQRTVTVQRTVVVDTAPAPVVVVRRWRARPGFTPVRSLILRRAFRGAW